MFLLKFFSVEELFDYDHVIDKQLYVFSVFSLLKTMKYICLMMKFGPMKLIVGYGKLVQILGFLQF